MMNSLILILVAVLLVVLAGLFAGAETGMYQLSRLRLRLGIQKKKLPFVILGKAMHDSPGLLLSMLIGTNLAQYFATSVVTYLLLSRVTGEHTAALFTTLITAPTLFVFSELIPKNIFFYRADALMPFFAPVIGGIHRLLTACGIVPLLKYISGILARMAGLASYSKNLITSTQRHLVKAIIQDTRDEGILSSVQTDIVNRIVGIPAIRLSSVMTALGKVRTADVDTDSASLLKVLEKTAFTRLPVFEREPTNIIGFINIYHCFAPDQDFNDLRSFLKPIRSLPSNTTVADAINIMQTENQKIVLVTRAAHLGRERPIGIVTMKDLVEELLGELTEW
jgi:CBS domain containing-hemolysin-like protein